VQKIKKERDRVVSLFELIEYYYSVRLSATNGNRIAEAVKVVRKIKADRREHIVRYSTTKQKYVNDLSRAVMIVVDTTKWINGAKKAGWIRTIDRPVLSYLGIIPNDENVRPSHEHCAGAKDLNLQLIRFTV
jgi:hypothetical protein